MRIRNNLAAVSRQLVRQFEEEVEASAEEAAQTMRDGAPVLSGELRDSIEADGGSIFIGADHWRHVNYGTSDTKAQPFVEPGIERGKQRMGRIDLDG